MNLNIKKILISWHVWVIVAVLGVFILFQREINAGIILPLALVIICPIMMMFMMKDGHKH